MCLRLYILSCLWEEKNPQAWTLKNSDLKVFYACGNIFCKNKFHCPGCHVFFNTNTSIKQRITPVWYVCIHESWDITIKMLIFVVTSLLLTTQISRKFVTMNYNSATACATFLSFEVQWWSSEKKDSILSIWDSNCNDCN